VWCQGEIGAGVWEELEAEWVELAVGWEVWEEGLVEKVEVEVIRKP